MNLKGELLGNYWLNYLTEFNLYINIVLIVIMICVKIFFLKIVKSRDDHGGIRNFTFELGKTIPFSITIMLSALL